MMAVDSRRYTGQPVKEHLCLTATDISALHNDGPEKGRPSPLTIRSSVGVATYNETLRHGSGSSAGKGRETSRPPSWFNPAAAPVREAAAAGIR